VGIAERDGERFYLLFDDTKLEQHEEFIALLLAGIVLATTLAATWFGFWLSGRVIRPIKDLAQRVQAIEPHEVSEPLARGFANDEVGDLATAFDAYQDRLAAFVCREREFTADASHELRSPLAVIRVTAEGMLANKVLPGSLQAKVERIMRAAEGMGGTLEVLLWLARENAEKPSVGNLTDLATELERLVAHQKEALAGRPVELDLDLKARPELNTPPAAAIMVVDNLLRNALAYTTDGRVGILLCEDRLVVEDNGPGIASADLQQVFKRGNRGGHVMASGRGLGLAIVNRLCERFGWTLKLESPAQGGVRAEWRFH
jgi:signal transduction histidine kinase